MFRIIWATPIGLSALLFFSLQPMIAKLILPAFGGGASIWIVCLVFFQVVLFTGYGYTFWLSKIRSLKVQISVHLVFLLGTLFWLPISPVFQGIISSEYSPTLLLFLFLTSTVFGPSAALCATSPLFQLWWSHAHSETTAYKFYSFSNIASLVGLFLYPFALEPILTLDQQIAFWSHLYLAFVVVTVLVLPIALRSNEANVDQHSQAEKLPSHRDLIHWILLPATGSILLLSISQILTTDIAPAPLLWILPLALYLLTYSIAFSLENFHLSGTLRVLFLVLFFLLPCILLKKLPLSTMEELLIALGSVFVFCSLLHGELSISKPKREALPLFYLLIAFGGGIGGLSVTVAAPILSNLNIELPIAMTVTFIVFIFSILRKHPSRWCSIILGVVTFSGAVLIFWLTSFSQYPESHRLYAIRNFYGQLVVQERPLSKSLKLRTLHHGSVEHGAQLIAATEREVLPPVSYYAPQSGIGLLFSHYEREFARSIQSSKKRLKVLAVGMGVGAISAYMQSEDVLRYIEVNPAVVDIAKRYFSYLSASPIEEQIFVSDGRVGLNRALRTHGPLGVDMIVLDAFNSDSIPTHLFTTEAFSLYFRHLKPDGAIAILYDTDYANLLPVLQGHANQNHKSMFSIHSDKDEELGIRAVSWAIITSRPALIADERFWQYKTNPTEPSIVWSDSFSDTWSVIDWR
ncbi:MAG: hypothetical protein KDD70_08380 [Bdellovibrionales bacterium]|nr:hypothetical protein [Bdellovibrionales bacterium]